MIRSRLWRVVVLLGLAPAMVAAASVEDLAWMVGDWRSGAGDGLVQEIWTEPRAGSMTGMFRWVDGGEVRVFEYLVIAEEAAGVFYRFKHFRPDYSTWEGDGPPLRLELVENRPGRAVFRNTREVEGQPSYITYVLGDDGSMSVYVGDAVVGGGDYRGFEFVLTNVDEEVDVPTDQKINYLELPARDLDAAQRFYEGAFGWKFTDYGPEYRAFNDGKIDGGFRRMDASSSTAANGAALIILYAEDLERTRQVVLDNGGTIVQEIFSFPGGRRFHFADPNGNELAVWSDR